MPYDPANVHDIPVADLVTLGFNRDPTPRQPGMKYRWQAILAGAGAPRQTWQVDSRYLETSEGFSLTIPSEGEVTVRREGEYMIISWQPES